MSDDATGYKIEFKKSGLTANWDPKNENLLELAEDAGVIADYSCRTGTCHTCLVNVVSGTFEYDEPDVVFAPDGEDEILLCSALPTSDMVIDV